ncbi:MAG: C10 family peptidase [Bacteroidales bacterium]|nr:C10 family peptidase [Bacteroidales bacterium]
MIRRLILLILWLIPIAAGAQTDPAAKAARIAWGLMGGRTSPLKVMLLQDTVIPIGDPASPAAYVVTYKPAGFVIISAQETGSPVLGYSLTSVFPTHPDHPLRSWLLPAYASRPSEPVILKGSQDSHYSVDRMVLPLVSAQWGQGYPWNRYCPADENGKHALVGCVAVAMSQIMEKWQWPLKGSGQVSYTPLQHPEYGELRAIFDTTHYRWDLSQDIDATEASALVLYHTGVASLMNYGTDVSGTSVDRMAVPALINYFSYHTEMVFRSMNGNSTSEWIRLLHQELDNSRPVLYSGTTPDGRSSHAFNIDGYRDETYFHFNWGWNGAGDGWYTLDGMAGGGSDFSSRQGAIFGMQPASIPLHDRPSAPDVLPGDGFAQLFWEQPVIADFSHFNIYRDDSLVGQTADTKFTDEGLENSRSYSYEITAFYQGQTSGESAATPALSATPWPRLQPETSQTFESGQAGWQLQGSESGFQIVRASELQIGGNTGYVAAIRSEGHPAGEQVADYLISPVIYPEEFSHPAISFDYLFHQNPGIDNLTLMWRDFETGTWQTLANLDSTGGNSDWKNKHIYLPLSAGKIPIQIAFCYNDFFGQGYLAAIDNIMVYQVAEPARPDFSADLSDLCLNQPVTITDLSTGTINTRVWDFGEGAEPRYASTPGPHVIRYTKAGAKTIKLSLNHLDHLTKPDIITIREKPLAGFQHTRKSMDITFTNQSTNAESLLWRFGDGKTSTLTNPVHTYYTKELFKVELIAYNGTCDADTITEYIDMRSGTGIDDHEFSNDLKVYPNPTDGRITLQWSSILQHPVTVRILSATGQILLQKEYPPQRQIELDLNHFSDGFYILQLSSGHYFNNQHIIKNASNH